MNQNGPYWSKTSSQNFQKGTLQGTTNLRHPKSYPPKSSTTSSGYVQADSRSTTKEIPKKSQENVASKSSQKHPRRASLKDLCTEDKQRVKQLIEDLARAGAEKEKIEERSSREKKKYKKALHILHREQKKILQEKQKSLCQMQEKLGGRTSFANSTNLNPVQDSRAHRDTVYRDGEMTPLGVLKSVPNPIGPHTTYSKRRQVVASSSPKGVLRHTHVRDPHQLYADENIAEQPHPRRHTSSSRARTSVGTLPPSAVNLGIPSADPVVTSGAESLGSNSFQPQMNAGSISKRRPSQPGTLNQPNRSLSPQCAQVDQRVVHSATGTAQQLDSYLHHVTNRRGLYSPIRSDLPRHHVDLHSPGKSVAVAHSSNGTAIFATAETASTRQQGPTVSGPIMTQFKPSEGGIPALGGRENLGAMYELYSEKGASFGETRECEFSHTHRKHPKALDAEKALKNNDSGMTTVSACDFGTAVSPPTLSGDPKAQTPNKLQVSHIATQTASSTGTQTDAPPDSVTEQQSSVHSSPRQSCSYSPQSQAGETVRTRKNVSIHSTVLGTSELPAESRKVLLSSPSPGPRGLHESLRGSSSLIQPNPDHQPICSGQQRASHTGPSHPQPSASEEASTDQVRPSRQHDLAGGTGTPNSPADHGDYGHLMGTLMTSALLKVQEPFHPDAARGSSRYLPTAEAKDQDFDRVLDDDIIEALNNTSLHTLKSWAAPEAVSTPFVEGCPVPPGIDQFPANLLARKRDENTLMEDLFFL